MNAKDAVARRIQTLCSERNMAINALANRCGIPPSTIYSMLSAKSQNPGVVSIQKICDGLEISVREFFDDLSFSCRKEGFLTARYLNICCSISCLFNHCF